MAVLPGEKEDDPAERAVQGVFRFQIGVHLYDEVQRRLPRRGDGCTGERRSGSASAARGDA